MRSTPAAGAVLTSNGEKIPFDEAHFAPMRDSSELLGNRTALRARLDEDGYLLLRGVLDQQDVLDLRRRYFELLPAGYLAPDTEPVAGLFSGTVPAELSQYGVHGHPAHGFVRSERFQEFCSAPALSALTAALLGGPTELLPRRILRHFWRGANRASRAHTDYEYMRLGTDQVLTTWIPIGDCPVATGGLVYLEGGPLDPEQLSRLRKVTDRVHDQRPISHDLAHTARETGRRWLWADFSTGDLTVHSPHIVHATLDTSTEAMRLSTDLRFQLRGEPVDHRWTTAWSADDGA
ncbi:MULTISPECIES: phytanoyl-CoA dioxygenase family protein [Kitasatospora]|uniref:phytanoyl-CoA dioxygenase family protein n=1 Tax=Kitasatospora TaxID=2063 RepID=UPI000CBEC85D|nr:phytanoyl-CoA dioxygenase family protein [Kitasatospora sp. GP30]MDH6140348.1 ectoine hydroxylase-related dioxygenase (phytanoyl-CoA dioxygenase family) [Kitasatospora sp. GP30]